MSATQRFSHGFAWLQQPYGCGVRSVNIEVINRLMPSVNVIGVVSTCTVLMACSQEISSRSRHTTGDYYDTGSSILPGHHHKDKVSSLKWPRAMSRVVLS